MLYVLITPLAFVFKTDIQRMAHLGNLSTAAFVGSAVPFANHPIEKAEKMPGENASE